MKKMENEENKRERARMDSMIFDNFFAVSIYKCVRVYKYIYIIH
jgi:hypothetical protein